MTDRERHIQKIEERNSEIQKEIFENELKIKQLKGDDKD